MFDIRGILAFATVAALAAGGAPPYANAETVTPGALRIAEGISDPALRQLAVEVLRRNPGLGELAAHSAAASLRAPQARALPDPSASLTAFLAEPETRTGPQRLSAGFSQPLPWLGKRELAERIAVREAEAREALVEAARLELVTTTRRLFHELTFLDRRRVIGEELRDHLSQHEEIARARYSTGSGDGQNVVKLQAEITLAEKELLDVRRHRVLIESRLNALRDRSGLTPVVVEEWPEERPALREVTLNLERLTEAAMRFRPELSSIGARLEGAETRVELAEMARRPDFRVGLTYTWVDPRDDPAARFEPPQGNGDDILGIQGGITLPLQRKSRVAAVEEALELQAGIKEAERAQRAAIEATVADLAQRVELNWRRLRLVEDLLIVQAEEAEESALAGYIAGTLSALDLLDAEHVRFEAHIALARSQADYLIQIAELEGAVGASLAGELEPAIGAVKP